MRQLFVLLFVIYGINANAVASLMASYALTSNLNDATGTFGAMTLSGSASRNASGIYGSGVYSNGGTSPGWTDANTPYLTGLTERSVGIAVDFYLLGYTETVICLGAGWRWLGINVDATTHKIGIMYNNGNTIYSNSTVSLNTWHTATIIYYNGLVQLFFNGSKVIDNNSTLPSSLTTGSDDYIYLTNYSNGKTFYGYLKNMKVYKNATATYGALPVELLDFSANVLPAHQVKLNWATATEINNDFFEIQRSSDAVEWEPVSNIKGAGNSNHTLYYNHIDEEPYYGLSYYRLRQVDYDGTESHSPIVTIHLDDSSTPPHIFNDMQNHQLIVQVNTNNKLIVTLFNTMGQQVFSTATDGNNYILNTSHFERGVYYVNAHNNEKIHVKKIILE